VRKEAATEIDGRYDNAPTERKFLFVNDLKAHMGLGVAAVIPKFRTGRR